MKRLVTADGDLVLVPSCWTFWTCGTWEYRRRADGTIEARDPQSDAPYLREWRALEPERAA